MAGPRHSSAAGGDQLRAGHADREQVIEVLKVAFVHGRLTRGELSARAGEALSARTCADLAALTADIPAIPSAPAATGRTRRSAPGPVRRRPLVKAAARSGGCLGIATVAVMIGFTLDPDGSGPNPYHSWAPLFLFIALAAVIAATGFLGYEVVDSVESRRSRRRRPPSPGPDSHALEGERRGGAGHDQAQPRPRSSPEAPVRPGPPRPAGPQAVAVPG
jgi:hypothetical protein